MPQIGEYLRSRFDGDSDDKVRYDLAGAGVGAGLGLLGADAIEASQMSKDKRRAMRGLPALEEEAERAKNVATDASKHKEWSMAQSLDDVGGDSKKYQLGKMYKELQSQLEFNDSPELRKQISELVQHMKDEGITTYDGPLAQGLKSLSPEQQHDLNVLRAGYGLFDDAPVHDIAEETLRNAKNLEGQVDKVKNMYKPGFTDYLPSPKRALQRGIGGALPYVTIGGALGLGAANYVKDYNAFKEDNMEKDAQELQYELEKEAANLLGGLKNVFKPLTNKIKSLKPEKPGVPKAGQNASQTASQAVENAPAAPAAPAVPSANPGPSLGKKMKRGALLVGAGGVGGYALSAGQTAYQQGSIEQQQAQQNKMASTGGNSMNLHDQLEKVAGEYVNAFGMKNEKGKQVAKDNKNLSKETGTSRFFGQRKAVRNMDTGYDTTTGDMVKQELKDTFNPKNVAMESLVLPFGGALAGGVAGGGVGKLMKGSPVGAMAGIGANLGAFAGGTAGFMRSSGRSSDNVLRDMEDRNNAMREYTEREKQASSIEEELEKIAGMMGNLTGSTVRGMKKNIAGAEAAGADASLLKKQLPAAQKSKAATQLGAGLLASGASGVAAVAGAKKHNENMKAESEAEAKAEKTASTFGEEAEKEKKDRPSTDKASDKDKDNKKDAENNIKDEKEKAEGRTWSDADKEGFVAKEAQSVDFMNELFKEAAANLSSEVMEKVASHTDALSRITASTFGYETRTR